MTPDADYSHPFYTRRSFLAGLATGLGIGGSLGWLALRQLGRTKSESFSSFTGISKEDPRPKFAMPGPFPGRVVEVKHPGSVRPDNSVDAGAVTTMMDRGMRELTSADHPVEAWRRFFEPGDVVGIK